jgi:GntR family transcriptional repressor for pyruvate dehydrogenase complex
MVSGSTKYHFTRGILVAINKIKKVVVHDAIIENIIAYIEEKDLQPGERLPSERNFAVGMGVSRGSVRGALKAIEASGMIEIRHGGGTYLISRTNLVYRRYDSSQLENLKQLRYLLAARRMIEERVVVDICPLVTLSQIQELYDNEEKQLYVLENDLADQDSHFEIPNLNFELQMTAILKNPVIYEMHDRIQTFWKQTYNSLSSTPYLPRERYEQHRAIIQGLGKRDPDVALKAMIYHNKVLQIVIESEIKKLEQQD